MSEERCFRCRWKSTGAGNGCGVFSKNVDLPIITNPSSRCIGRKPENGGQTRFELAERFVKHGKHITPYETSDHPKHGILAGEPLETDGEYSIVCREGRGSFRVNKQGDCFSDDDEMRPIGHISDFDERQFTQEEIDEGIRKLRQRIREGF